MNKNTIVRVKVPAALYESLKGKVIKEAFKNPRAEAFDTLESLRDFGVSDTKILEYVLGNAMNGSEAEEAMRYAYEEFIGDDLEGEEDLDEAKKKPSAGLTKKEKSAVVKRAKSGKDIGKKGKGFEKVATKAAKEYGSKERGQKVAAAAMWKGQAAKKKAK